MTWEQLLAWVNDQARTPKDLQEACRGLGLPDHGNRLHLRSRLCDHINAQSNLQAKAGWQPSGVTFLLYRDALLVAVTMIATFFVVIGAVWAVDRYVGKCTTPVKPEWIVEKETVVVTATPTQTPLLPMATPVPPTPTLVPPTSTPVPVQSCLFDLRKSIRGLPGVSIVNDRSDWDGKANGLVSFVKIDCTTASLLFERWGPPGSWMNLEETHKVSWGSGEYNLQELFYPSGEKDLNDTLQTVLVQPGGQVELREHDEAPWGIKILLSCPGDP